MTGRWIFTLSKGKICCFTGHRPDKLSLSENKIKALLKTQIKKAVSDGFVYFISGMALGFDIWAAETVISLSEEYPEISLICAVPYSGFERNRCKAEKEKYEYILKHAKQVHVLSPKYTYSCFQFRNMWMVDRSELVIAACNGQKSGTKNTVDYAMRNGIEVLNILF